jgi:transcription termination factor Rho
VRRHKQKTEEEIVAIKSAKYLYDFTIAISFTNGKTKPVDFLPLFQKYVKGENLIYFSPQEFKKFIVKNGNIFWGENEDVIFPIDLLLKGKSQSVPEDILYII